MAEEVNPGQGKVSSHGNRRRPKIYKVDHLTRPGSKSKRGEKAETTDHFKETLRNNNNF